jgi:predicted acyl esterase
MIEEKDVMIPVRDGAKMAVRIYRPEGSGPFPTLFATSPYRYDNNALPAYALFLWRETGPIEWYIEQGYAYVYADVRGTGVSELGGGAPARWRFASRYPT